MTVGYRFLKSRLWEKVRHFYPIDQVQLSDRPLVGSLSFYLARLAQAQQPIQPSIIISHQVFSEFLSTVQWLEPFFADLPNSSLHLDIDNARQLQSIAQQIRRELLAAPLPDDWLDTLHAIAQQWQCTALRFYPSLHVVNRMLDNGGLPLVSHMDCPFSLVEREAIASNLKQTWAELFRASSLLYWQQARIPLNQIGMGVVMQAVYPTLRSGGVQNQHQQVWVRSVSGYGWDAVIELDHTDFYRLDNGQVVEQQIGVREITFQLSQTTTEVRIVPQESADPASPLQPEHWPSLLAIAQTLTTLDTPVAASWSLCQASPTAPWRVQINQVLPCWHEPRLSALGRLARAADETQATKVIRGLAASGGQKIGRVQVVAEHPGAIAFAPETILVAPQIQPDWLPLLRQLGGMITETGSITSHSAILAREMQIPAVLGVPQATRIFHTGDRVLLDGDRGEIYRLSEEQIAEYQAAQRQHFAKHPHPTQRPELLNTPLWVNLSQRSTLAQIQDWPVSGVGLLRSELMLLEVLEGQSPQAWLLQGKRDELLNRWVALVSHIAAALFPRPVFYRSLDWRSHELAALTSPVPASTQEAGQNSVLGLRGTLRYQAEPDLFLTELTALKRVHQAGYPNVNLLLPFVRTVEEFNFCQSQIAAIGLRDNPQFQLWIMAEVPSILFLLPDYVRAGVQGISIGTNDLGQLILGLDRDAGEFRESFNVCHPAILRAIAQIIHLARQQQIPCSICGQATSQCAGWVEKLIEWGISSISVEPAAIAQVYAAIAQAERMGESSKLG